MQEPPLAAVEALSYRYGGQQALDAVSAEIRAGEITGLAGPDGSGKTTLLRLLAGLLKPGSGVVRVLGRDMAADAASLHHSIGYMPQRFGLYEDLTVAENLSLHADLHNLEAAVRAERIAMLLHFTELAAFTDRLAGKLSGGMKQKLGLGCALLARPRLLLLDEPSVGVDPASRRELWAIVQRMMSEDGGETMGVVWATSYLDEAERCARVLLLHEGRLLSAAPPAEFLAPLRNRSFLLPLAPEARRHAVATAMREPEILDALMQGDQLRVILREPASAPRIMGMAARATAPRFEDGFVDLLLRRMPAAPAAQAVPPPATAPASEVIRIAALTKKFGRFTAVDDANFSISRGEIFGLLGPNGAGKSTIFRMLCGLLRPSSGTALVAGKDLLTAPAEARARLGYMAQRFALYGELTVRQNLQFFARVYGLAPPVAAAAVAAAEQDFALAEVGNRPAAALPLGHKQRLALAAALLHGPQILFLDEPTSGVDPLARRAFWARITLLADRGVTVLVTSHFMEEAEYCDRLAIVNAGRIIATGTPAELRAKVRGPQLPEPTLEDAFIALVAQARSGNDAD